MKEQVEIEVKWNNAATNDPCAICGRRTDPIVGPDFFLKGTYALVCDDCANQWDEMMRIDNGVNEPEYAQYQKSGPFGIMGSDQAGWFVIFPDGSLADSKKSSTAQDARDEVELRMHLEKKANEQEQRELSGGKEEEPF